jgi:(2Fe-2S) ferredoxin
MTEVTQDMIDAVRHYAEVTPDTAKKIAREVLTLGESASRESVKHYRLAIYKTPDGSTGRMDFEYRGAPGTLPNLATILAVETEINRHRREQGKTYPVVITNIIPIAGA